MRIQHSILAIASAAVLTLTGCASSMGIGESGLTCPAGEGMPCTDSRTVFERTHNFTPGDSMYGERVRGESGSGSGSNGHSGSPQPFENFDVDVRGGAISQPLPIRTGAKVMRIWVNSHVDERGDLVYPSLLYTEITPRQWNVGNSASKSISPRRITPLRVKEEAANTRTTPLQSKQTPSAPAVTPPSAPVNTAPLLPAPPIK